MRFAARCSAVSASNEPMRSRFDLGRLLAPYGSDNRPTRQFLARLPVTQLEHVECVPGARIPHVRCQQVRHVAGTPAAEPGRYRHVLLAVDAEADREPLNRCAEPPFPEHLAGPNVVRPEPPVEITREDEAAPSREGRRVE